MKEVFESYREVSTVKTKALGQAIQLDPQMLDTPRGQETQMYRAGQSVVSTGNGAIKAGVRLVIQDVIHVHGYWRYFAGGMWLNQDDIESEDQDE